MPIEAGFDERYDEYGMLRVPLGAKCRWCKKTAYELEDPGGLCEKSVPGYTHGSKRSLQCHGFVIGSG